MVTAAGREKARGALTVVEKTDAAFFEPVGTGAGRLVKLFKVLVRSSDVDAAIQTPK